MSSIDKAYYSNEVAGAMNIGGSTLRKWCLALEEQGYAFIRGRNNSRAFTEQELIVLRRMKELIQNKGITLETAAEIVMAGIQQTERTEGVLQESSVPQVVPQAVIPENNYEQQFQEVFERLDKQEAFNRELINKLEEQSNYIKDSLERRDRQLLEAIRESQESRKLIAASIEKQEEERQLQQNKSFWKRLFGK